MGLLLLATTLVGCGGDNSDNGGTQTNNITVSSDNVSFKSTASSQTLTITADHEWGTSVSDASWITVSPTNSTKGQATMTITVAANLDTDVRSGSVTIMAGTARKVIAVTQAAGTGEGLPVGPEGYKLVWNDEFDKGTDLDPANWTYEVQPSGWVNNELQNYVEGNYQGQKVAELADGKLFIHAFKASDNKVYSARVYAHVATGWQYGYFEASIKLPVGKGTWPAFWMMPVHSQSWPKDGEIDIMENVGYNPNVVLSTIHCTKYNNGGTSKESGNKVFTNANRNDFHKYAVKWTPDEMIFYVDDDVILTYPNEGTIEAWPFGNPFYVILNLAWGGAWGGAQGIDESALPVTMEIDYVRVFQQK